MFQCFRSGVGVVMRHSLERLSSKFTIKSLNWSKEIGIDACESLLNRNKINPLLKRMVTGDEKWVTYDNVRRKRSWSKSGEAAQTVAKPGLTARKVLLCVWWNWQGIIHYELLPYGQTLNSDLYCQQLDRLKAALMQKGPSLINRGQRQAAHIFGDAPEASGARMRGSFASIE